MLFRQLRFAGVRPVLFGRRFRVDEYSDAELSLAFSRPGVEDDAIDADVGYVENTPDITTVPAEWFKDELILWLDIAPPSSRMLVSHNQGFVVALAS
jgi:hypothetical protein